MKVGKYRRTVRQRHSHMKNKLQNIGLNLNDAFKHLSVTFKATNK